MSADVAIPCCAVDALGVRCHDAYLPCGVGAYCFQTERVTRLFVPSPWAAIARLGAARRSLLRLSGYDPGPSVINAVVRYSRNGRPVAEARYRACLMLRTVFDPHWRTP